MVSIPAGCFEMGSPSGQGFEDESPRHLVCLSGFRMDATEVTQGTYQNVMGNNPSHYDDCGPDCPVGGVDWYDANDYCRRVGKRLPTEAEWEYAVRAGSATEYFWGDDPSSAGRFVWFHPNSDYTPHPVGQKLANPWGLYDMAGNVWEWVSDWKGDYPSSSQRDPGGPSSGGYRVVRGGSWSDGATDIRSAYRLGLMPDQRHGFMGFRCVSSGPRDFDTSVPRKAPEGL